MAKRLDQHKIHVVYDRWIEWFVDGGEKGIGIPALSKRYSYCALIFMANTYGRMYRYRVGYYAVYGLFMVNCCIAGSGDSKLNLATATESAVFTLTYLLSVH